MLRDKSTALKFSRRHLRLIRGEGIRTESLCKFRNTSHFHVSSTCTVFALQLFFFTIPCRKFHTQTFKKKIMHFISKEHTIYCYSTIRSSGCTSFCCWLVLLPDLYTPQAIYTLKQIRKVENSLGLYQPICYCIISFTTPNGFIELVLERNCE